MNGSEARVLSVIPARGGSKRVPEKNIRELGGKPLIAHSIEQADEAAEIDRSIVSTEDQTIREVAQSHGADVPFDRPDHLASDTATNNEVVAHALDWFSNQDESFDVVCLVLPTNPFRTSEDIDNAISKVTTTNATSAIGVCSFDMPPFYAFEINDGDLEPYFGEEYFTSKTRTQEVPDLHHPNGSLYVADVDSFVEKQSFYTGKTAAYQMPRERSIDIDTPFDLKLAQALIEHE